MNDAPGKADADRADYGGAAIAIVGMSGRFPGAKNVRELWKNLREGVESIRRFKPDELEDAFADDVRASPEFVPARSVLENVDQFDAEFFAMQAREAALTDPQHRVFLECCWEALEDAGWDPAAFKGPIGVFAGSAYNSYLIKHVLGDRAAVDEFTSNFQVGSYQELLGSLADVLATRVAYKLDLKGPAVNVQSACSTSLLAVAQACQSLLLFQSDMALAGGVSISFPQKRGYLSLDGGMVSHDGRCRPFDAQASGTVFGAGAGVVVLKRLDDALADGDQIYAVIRGFGVNNDGAQKVGFTAPSSEGQAAVIAAALAMADVDPSTIGYVECHGTATPLGDPIEFNGLLAAFRASTAAKNFCTLGSAKANFGHLDAAAGVTGLIKATLTLKHAELPPLVHFTAPNPNIDLASSPFKFNSELTPWPRDGGPRRAGVSAFGVGGTNVHLVLEEAPQVVLRASEKKVHILPLSARTPESIAQAAANLAAHLKSEPTLDLADVAHTLQRGRRTFDHRAAIAASSIEEAATKLANFSSAQARSKTVAQKIVFMFPGQGAQYPGMGKALYDSEPVFRDHFDRGARVLKPLIETDLHTLLYGDVPADDDAPHPVRSTVLAQPSLFVVEYATAQLLLSRGIEPSAMIGHSLGEFVAACLAGVLSFEDALKLVALRGRLMQNQQPGAMLGVRASEAKLAEFCGNGVEIAAVNAPALSVASGPFAAIEKLEQQLDAAGISHRRLHTSHAFHSAMMDGVVDALKVEAARVAFAAPKRRYVSAVTGTWARAEEAASPDYWARHCRETVRFAPALATLLEEPDLILLEVGPGRTLSTFAGQAKNKNIRATLQTLPEFANRGEDCTTFAEALAGLWSEGVALDWSKMSARGRRISLPSYAFARKRHWIEAPAPVREIAISPNLSSRATDPGLVPGEGDPGPRSLRDESEPSLLGPGSRVAEAPLGRDDSVFSEALPLSAVSTQSVETFSTESNMTDSRTQLQRQIQVLLEELSGESLDGASPGASFLELGFDSLLLGQVVKRLQKAFGVKVTFRQLMREYPSMDALTDHVMKTAKPDALPAASAPAVKPTPQPTAAPAPVAATAQVQAQPIARPMQPIGMPQAVSGSGIENVLQNQLVAMQQLIAQQLQTLQTIAGVPVAMAPSPQPVVAPQPAAPAKAGSEITFDEPTPSRFAMYKPGQKSSLDTITPEKHRFIADLVDKYAKKMPGSKARTQASRGVLADPRSAAGFRAEWKEMVFPIVCARSKGSKLWDVDGNEFVDLVNGFGQTMFGHAPDFVLDAVAKQMKEGFAIGPQSPLAAEVARMFAEMTGNERVTFCNTGSEAVMAAMRVARTVTGREKVVVFSGAYHGMFDEVLVKPGASKTQPGAMPVAPGIPQESVDNMIVLPYANPQSLAWVRANAEDLAAVIVETVQSRHPNLQPRDFLMELRAITDESGSALVFDEVVTGFRVHPGGMQAIFGIKADMATYGKVVGGGMPVGVLAGKAAFMDALDGGHWSFGDDSVPETAPTFFAGTFVRHPMTLAACHAVLTHLKEQGPALQQKLTESTKRLTDELNAALAKRKIKTRLETFASWCYANFTAEDPLASLFYHHMRLCGVHLLEGFPWFLTTAHSEADFAKIVSAFTQSIDALQAAGILAPQDGPDAPSPGPNGSRPSTTTTHASRPMAGVNGSGAKHAETASIEVPLTEAQMEVWLAAELSEGASCAYNESVTLSLEGALKAESLIGALNDIVARHDALRATITRSGERLRISPALKLDVPIVDLTGARDRDARVKAILDEEARTPFNLADGPLCRARLLRFGPESHALVFTAHHIICDGWSMGTIMGELGACYSARREGAAPDLPETLPFHRYARDRANEKPEPRIEEFWLNEFKDLPPAMELPTDRPRPSVKTFRGATYTDYLDALLVASVKKAGSRYGATLFASLFAAVQVTLGKLSGQSDIALTVPMAGQTLIEDEVLVGHCVDFLPVRLAFDETAPFGAYLDRVKTKVLAAMDHQGYTYGTLVQRLGIKRDPNRTPITDVQFNLEKFGGGLEFSGLEAKATSNPKAFVNFDLFFNMTESAQGIRIDVDYATDLYDEATIKRWIGYMRALLGTVAADPSRVIADLSLLSETEARWLLDDLNPTAVSYPRDAMLHELIAAQAAKTPEAIAFTCDKATLTYAALEVRADHLARRLAALIPDSSERVAVALPRGLDLPIALLAVLKSGNAYVPLDPTHPPARLSQTLEAADVVALICADDAIAELGVPGIEVVRLDGASPALAETPNTDRRRHDASQAAYVIFTSGSTGTPKGVEISHRAVVNFMLSMAVAPGFTRSDIIVAVTTISFDIAGLELFLPLITGGQAVIADREQVRSGTALVDLVERTQATVLQATPSLWRLLLEAGLKPGPRLKMLCGGEPLPRDLANRLLEGGGELWNVYGPTETTIWSSAGPVTSGDAPITIGAPIANTQIHILDTRDALVPVGVIGDVYIGGDGLARGYFNRADLTAAAFREIGIAGRPKQRLYRTGDVGRRLADGSVQLLGRKDHQVKLRGYRIELEDIEAHLRRTPGLTDAAVAVQGGDDGDARLVGYYVTADTADVAPKTLARHLSVKLPDYMVPTVWQRLDALPMTANGKLNRKALPPVQLAPATPASDAAPITRSVLEETVAQIWADLLKRQDITADSHFFDAGGHSLLAMRMIARLESALDRPMTVATLFRAPRLADFVKLIGSAAGDPDANKIIRIQPNGARPPVIVLNNAWNLFPLSKALAADQPMISIQFVDRSISEPKPVVPFNEIVDEAVRLVRKAQPAGPYVLLGHCVLGSVAIEAARKLKAEGDDVALVAMFDTEPNLKFSGVRLSERLYNYWMLEARRLRWYAGLWAGGHVNGAYVLARYKTAHILGLVRIASLLGLKERWYQEDFHTQHVVDAWMMHTSKPYDGDVALYRAVPHERQGFLDRYLPWLPSWRSTIRDRLVVEDVKIPHAEMFREPGAAIIGGHLARLLDKVWARVSSSSAKEREAAFAGANQRQSHSARVA